jgi:RNA polymerase sigma-70 factor (ECF subfamily)
MVGEPEPDTSLTLLDQLHHNPSDPQAWSLFVERYRPRIYNWCLTWGLKASDAEDVVQDVLVKLFGAMTKFQYDPERSFRAWLKTVTKHAWCDFIAARYKEPGANARPIDAIADSSDAQSDLERQIEDASDCELVHVAMHRVRNRVKPATWAAFRLTVIDGLTGAAAAQRLQMPVAHVFVAKNRVQKMLHQEAEILRNG